jgi:hypothetical protein
MVEAEEFEERLAALEQQLDQKKTKLLRKKRNS